MNHSAASPKFYAVVYILLLGLTAATTGIARVDLGPLNVVVALAIAGIKALLVGLFFMHLIYVHNRTKIVVAAGVLWLLILIVFSVGDVLSRGWLAVPSFPSS